MANRLRKIRQFKCYDNAGQVVDIVEYIEVVPDPSFGDPDATIDGLRVFRTARTGKAVNPIGSDLLEFEVLEGSKQRRVRRATPESPR
jgi:hypothetical protein